MKTQSVIISILLAISVGLGISYYQAKKEIKFLSESKNMYFKWSESNETLGVYWTNNDKIAEHHIDRNFDFNFEISNTYNLVGQLIQTNYDSNEDGVYERGKVFNSYGETVGRFSDTDEDREIDKFSIILDNGNEIEFIDNDVDGRYERVIIKDSLRTSELAIEDFFKSK